jgi:hypothetical protein
MCHQFRLWHRLQSVLPTVQLRPSEQASIELGCHFFNAATVTTSSNVDGVHLDTEQHLKLGQAIDRTVEAAF